MKKTLSTILYAVCVIALFLACGQTEDGGVCVAWTLGWLATAVISALAANIIDGKAKEAQR